MHPRKVLESWEPLILNTTLTEFIWPSSEVKINSERLPIILGGRDDLYWWYIYLFMTSNKNRKLGWTLTTERKKSTWGLLWTKNLTGCLSIVTFNTKSGGVPGLTLGLNTPSWWECIKVSSRSRTNTFFRTMLSRCLDMGDNGEMSYFMALCCWTWNYYQLLHLSTLSLSMWKETLIFKTILHEIKYLQLWLVSWKCMW